MSKTRDIDTDACGAIGCTTTTELVAVTVGARERVLCQFHANAFQEGED